MSCDLLMGGYTYDIVVYCDVRIHVSASIGRTSYLQFITERATESTSRVTLLLVSIPREVNNRNLAI